MPASIDQAQLARHLQTHGGLEITNKLGVQVPVSMDEPFLPIGAGVFGTVYAGRLGSSSWFSEEARPRVAVKVVDLDGMKIPSRNAWYEEVQILQRMKPHPNVIQFVARLEQLPYGFLVTELATGGDLEFYLRYRRLKTETVPSTSQLDGSLEDRIARSFVGQLASGIHHLHSHNIIHRDIKPANILLNEDPDGSGIPLLRITDFGLSRVLDANSLASTFAGSPPYMAPEISVPWARRKRNPSARIARIQYDASVDLYSMGVVILEIFTGIDANDLQKAVLEVVQANLRNETNLPDHFAIPEDVDRLIRSVLWLEGDERASLDDFYELARIAAAKEEKRYQRSARGLFTNREVVYGPGGEPEISLFDGVFSVIFPWKDRGHSRRPHAFVWYR